MSDPRTDNDLETRVRDAFQSRELPSAPASLVDALERVPDAPVVAGAAAGTGRRPGRQAGFWILGLAAVLLVGGTLALTGGSRPPAPLPSPSGPLSGEASSPSPALPGARITYQVIWNSAVAASAPALAEEVRIVQARLDATGVVGATVRSEGDSGLIADVPPGVAPDPLRRLIGQTGRIAFVPLGAREFHDGDVVDPTAFPELFGSEGISGAAVSSNQTGVRVVEIDLAGPASEQFRQFTASHIGTYFAITMDDHVVTAPIIQAEIAGGRVEIGKSDASGGWDPVAADALVTIIRLGPLPAPLMEIASGPGPEDPLASGVPTPAIESQQPAVACPDPLVIERPRLACEQAVRAASENLPLNHPAIVSIRFEYACFGPVDRQTLAVDCAIDSSGIARFSFAQGPAAFVGVKLGADGTGMEVAHLDGPDANAGAPIFTLERAPADLGCDAIRPPYQSFSFRINLDYPSPVWAVANTKAHLRVLWGAADVGIAGPAPGRPASRVPTLPIVVDRFGVEMAVSGTRVEIPDGGWPSLAGRFVCPGPDAVYITDQPSMP